MSLSEKNIRKADGDLLESGRVRLLVGDGWQGVSESAPFDAIHVGAAAASLPLQLVQQLRVGGRMIVPVGPDGGAQYLLQVVGGGVLLNVFHAGVFMCCMITFV